MITAMNLLDISGRHTLAAVLVVVAALCLGMAVYEWWIGR